MQGFTREAIKKLLDTAQELGEGWLVCLVCQDGVVVTIKREAGTFPIPNDLNPDGWLDIQRILNDKFWGDLEVYGIKDKIVRVHKREIRKPPGGIDGLYRAGF